MAGVRRARVIAHSERSTPSAPISAPRSGQFPITAHTAPGTASTLTKSPDSSFIAKKTNGKNSVLVLGDLNTGPASAGPPPISGELSLDYQLLLDSGLIDAVSTSFCADNALRGTGARDLFIDHALLRGFAAKG
ncbi:MAG TPA: hypothetical protein VHM25_14600, partial [Polyangiaceae bacterium]|nr:hypothetical protein [Polyangiaceae bacterium]